MRRKESHMAHIKRPPKPTLCFICESPLVQATTDHVIPRQLFDPGNPPPNLFTLPACRSCNEGLSEDEELFRIFVLAQCYAQPEAQSLWDGKVRRSLVDSPAFRKMLAAQVHPTPLPAPFFSPTGEYIGEGKLLVVPKPRIEPVLKKIIRGLFYRHTSAFLGRCAFQIVHFDPFLTYTEEQVLFEYWKGAPVESFGNVLTYWYRVSQDDAGDSIWWLLFYGRVLFIVTTEPQNGS
jgi:hypothetical protein